MVGVTHGLLRWTVTMVPPFCGPAAGSRDFKDACGMMSSSPAKAADGGKVEDKLTSMLLAEWNRS
jgi:hypothetical protein